MYRHTYRVKRQPGHRSEFPIDMLRYDASYPHHQADTITIMRVNDVMVDADDLPEVELQHASPDKSWSPTHGRWESFGWMVFDVRSQKA